MTDAFANGRVLLQVTDLHKEHRLLKGWRKHTVPVLRGVSLRIQAGEILALVGESGSGKSTLARCLLRIEEPTSGSISINGEEFLSGPPSHLRMMRRRIQMIFQDPYGSLNPRKRVRSILGDVLRAHAVRDEAAIKERVYETLLQVGLTREVAAQYPSALSGGQRQRVGIGRALIPGPALVVADECVSALDVSIQAQIINLLLDLRERLGIAYLFITHDLRMVRHLAPRVAVMYAGKIVESGPTQQVFTAPAHPYTKALIEASTLGEPGQRGPGSHCRVGSGKPVIPEQENDRAWTSAECPPGEASPSQLADESRGCRYFSRCGRGSALCRIVDPPLTGIDPDREVACHHPLALSLGAT